MWIRKSLSSLPGIEIRVLVSQPEPQSPNHLSFHDPSLSTSARNASRRLIHVFQNVALFLFFFTMALPAHSGPRPLIQFRNHFSQTAGLLGRVISPSRGRYLNTGQHKHRINAYTYQTSMLWVGFEPKIPVYEREKTVHALDRALTVSGCSVLTSCEITCKTRRICGFHNAGYEFCLLGYNIV
jgi:hypothetical protein